MDALTPEQAALRVAVATMNTGGPCSGLSDSCTRPSHRSVANYLTPSQHRFNTLPLSMLGLPRIRLAGLGFRTSLAGSPRRPAKSRSSSYGPMVHLQLLSTPPRGGAVTFGFRPESACLGRTCTSLIEYTLRRTWVGQRPTNSAQCGRWVNHPAYRSSADVPVCQ